MKKKSTVLNGFFPYLVQMITSMRGCVACDDPWPWPISSRSFRLDLENRVRSVASTVLDGFFLYLAPMNTIIRGCVACYVFFRIWIFEFLASFLHFSALTLKKNLQFSMDSFHIWYKWSLAWEGVSHVMTFVLDLYLQGYSMLFWLGIPHDSIVWVIMRWRGVSSERRRSSCSSFFQWLIRAN